MASIVSVSVPIWLTLIRMLLATLLVDAALQPLGVGDEQIVADQLHSIAQPLAEQLPAFPIVFAAAVFDRADRIFFDPAGQEIDHAGRIDARGRRRVGLLLRVVELGGGDVQGDRRSAWPGL